MHKTQTSSGFTLIELLVVIAVIAVLVAIFLPAVQQARESARSTACRNNLKQITLALHNYHDTNGIFPSGQYFCKPGTACANSASFGPGWGWTASILPYVDQTPTFNELNFTLAMNDPVHLTVISRPIPVFTCPSDATRVDSVPPSGSASRPERIATTNYCGNGGSFGFSFQAPALARDERATNGVFGRDSARRFVDVYDGLSCTLLAGEVIHYNFPWDPTLFGHWNPNTGTACCTLSLVRVGSWPMNPGFDGTQLAQRESFSSLHPGGAHFALCDGSVRFISENIDASQRSYNIITAADPFDAANGGAKYRTWQRLFSRNDGLMVADF
jgi:prepilin-type N-terminal cleavage/methylation domain-containing protein/prepilin-type processing-associated H-X9-DG protein